MHLLSINEVQNTTQLMVKFETILEQYSKLSVNECAKTFFLIMYQILEKGIQAYLYCAKMFENPFIQKKEGELGFSCNHMSWLETFRTTKFDPTLGT